MGSRPNSIACSWRLLNTVARVGLTKITTT
jgi:hypothetical protein